MPKSKSIWLDPFAATWVFLFRREINTRCGGQAWGIWRLATRRVARLATAAGRPIRRMAGGGWRGFALFCLATDGLTLLPMPDPLWPRAELDRLDLLTAGVLTAGPPQNQFSVRLADA